MSSDNSTITPEQCRAARAMLGWSEDRLASEAHATPSWLAAFEGGRSSGEDGNLDAIRRVLEKAGIEFLADGAGSAGGGPGLRQRASSGYIESDQLNSANDG